MLKFAQICLFINIFKKWTKNYYLWTNV